VLTPRDEGHIVACLEQPAADDASDGTSSVDDEAHVNSLPYSD
jgi:hypothetical protein